MREERGKRDIEMKDGGKEGSTVRGQKAHRKAMQGKEQESDRMD